MGGDQNAHEGVYGDGFATAAGRVGYAGWVVEQADQQGAHIVAAPLASVGDGRKLVLIVKSSHCVWFVVMDADKLVDECFRRGRGDGLGAGAARLFAVPR